MALSKELKEAVLALPASEKDKMLLKLLAKHDDLQRQLEYQLLEFGETLETRKTAIKRYIDQMFAHDAGTPGWLMMDMRSANALITDHVKITKDKYGEIELTLYLLNGLFDHWLPYIEKLNSRTDSLAGYVAKRVEAILKKLEKLHEDIQFDFLKDTNLLLSRLYQYAPASYARQMKLPKEWN